MFTTGNNWDCTTKNIENKNPLISFLRKLVFFVWEFKIEQFFQSSILQLLLSELRSTNGRIYLSGPLSYASQEPWLFVATVRQNILFGLPYNSKKYKEVSITSSSSLKIAFWFTKWYWIVLLFSGSQSLCSAERFPTVSSRWPDASRRERSFLVRGAKSSHQPRKSCVQTGTYALRLYIFFTVKQTCGWHVIWILNSYIL